MDNKLTEKEKKDLYLNKQKIKIMEDWLFHSCKTIIKDYYPDYFQWNEHYNFDETDDATLIDMFDKTESIINKKDMDDYELTIYYIWLFHWMK